RHATQLSFRSGRRVADPRAEMVGAKGLGDEARQAKGASKDHSRRRAQARGHSAPHVDRPNRVQLGEEGGWRVTSNNEIKRFPQQRREKMSPPERRRGGGAPDFFGASSNEDAVGTIFPQPPS